MKNLYEYCCHEAKLSAVPENDVVIVSASIDSKEIRFILDKIQITRIIEECKWSKNLHFSVDVQSDDRSINFRMDGDRLIIDVRVASDIRIPMPPREFFTFLHLCDDYIKEYSIAQMTRKMIFDDFALTIAQLGVHFGCGGADSIIKKL